jgi:hypothetical protein
MIRSFPRGLTMKTLRWNFTLLSGLSLGLHFACAGLTAQNPLQPGAVAPKYRTHLSVRQGKLIRPQSIHIRPLRGKHVS